jgi:UPF0271 protein
LPGAVLENPGQVAENAVKLATEGIRFGEKVIFPDTLCLHGDNIHAAENARIIREKLAEKGIAVSAL